MTPKSLLTLQKDELVKLQAYTESICSSGRTISLEQLIEVSNDINGILKDENGSLKNRFVPVLEC